MTAIKTKTYFGFALSDSMFRGDAIVERKELGLEQVKEKIINGVESCLNSSHVATIQAMKEKFGLEVGVPEKPPIVNLTSGDSLIVMAVRGLPRLTDRHEYTEEEVAGATFTFAEWTLA